MSIAIFGKLLPDAVVKPFAEAGQAGEAMEWVGIIIVAIGAYFVGKSSRSQKVLGIAPSRSGIAAATDREIMLSTFRRELANYLVRLDPDRYLRLYCKARSTETAIEKADKDERDAQLLLLTRRYAQYEDFDLVNTRAHVLYADALDMHSLEEIEEHFLNLVKFQALQRTFDEDWQFRGPATTDRDLEHLQDYVRKIKDTRFLQRLKNAVQEFYLHRRNDQQLGPGEPVYETNVLVVFRLPHYAEIRDFISKTQTSTACMALSTPIIAIGLTKATTVQIACLRLKTT